MPVFGSSLKPILHYLQEYYVELRQLYGKHIEILGDKGDKGEEDERDEG